jgi:hypothetical protein
MEKCHGIVSVKPSDKVLIDRIYDGLVADLLAVASVDPAQRIVAVIFTSKSTAAIKIFF